MPLKRYTPNRSGGVHEKGRVWIGRAWGRVAGMWFTDSSQREAIPCSCRSLRPLSAEFHTEFSLAPWNGSKRSYKTYYLIGLRARVTRGAMRMARSFLNSWMRFEPLSLAVRRTARSELVTPMTCFGPDNLVGGIVAAAEGLARPAALIGTGV